MKMTTVESSNIQSLGYNKESEKMHVLFHTGQKYEYHPVSHDLFINFLGAESIGKFFAAHIKTNKPISFKKV